MYLILLLGIFCAPWLRYLFINLNIDLTEFGRKGWFGAYSTYIFTWLIVLIILVNPPFYDEESPRIELAVLPGMQEPGGTINIVAYIQDNVGIKNEELEFKLIYPNGTIISPDFTFENNILEYTFENTDNISGQYNFSISATDVNGHTNKINSSFGYSSETIEIISSFEGIRIRSGDVITIKADEKIFKEAKKHLQKVTEMEPNLSLAYFLSGQVDMKESHHNQGVARIEKAVALENDNPMILSALGWAYGIAGREKEAQQIFVRLEEMSRDRFISGFLYAKIYAGLGDKDRAFEYLEKAYQQRAMSLAVIITDETVENLRSDPRFMELLKKINLDKYVSL